MSKYGIKYSADIRVNNKKRIIQMLRLSSMTKREISNKLSLSNATVSNLCNALVEEKILHTEPSNRSNGGRIPEKLSLIPFSRYAVCLNLVERDIITLAIVDIKGNIVLQEHLEYSSINSMNKLAKFCADSTYRILNDMGIDQNAIMGVGVAIPGTELLPSGKVYDSTNMILNEQKVKKELSQYLDYPIYIENEANSVAFAIYQENLNKKELRNIIYFYVGDGIGVGIVSDGQLIEGAHGAGAEINHLPIGKRSYKCYCNNRGCIDTEISIVGFQKKYFDDKGIEHPTNRFGFKMFEDDACSGEEKASKIIAENGEIMGKAISVLCQMFDPKVVYVGGFDQAIYELLYPYIRKEVNNRSVFNNHFQYDINFDNGFHNMITKGCFHIVLDKWLP